MIQKLCWFLSDWKSLWLASLTVSPSQWKRTAFLSSSLHACRTSLELCTAETKISNQSLPLRCLFFCGTGNMDNRLVSFIEPYYTSKPALSLFNLQKLYTTDHKQMITSCLHVLYYGKILSPVPVRFNMTNRNQSPSTSLGPNHICKFPGNYLQVGRISDI